MARSLLLLALGGIESRMDWGAERRTEEALQDTQLRAASQGRSSVCCPSPRQRLHLPNHLWARRPARLLPEGMRAKATEGDQVDHLRSAPSQEARTSQGWGRLLTLRRELKIRMTRVQGAKAKERWMAPRNQRRPTRQVRGWGLKRRQTACGMDQRPKKGNQSAGTVLVTVVANEKRVHTRTFPSTEPEVYIGRSWRSSFGEEDWRVGQLSSPARSTGGSHSWGAKPSRNRATR